MGTDGGVDEQTLIRAVQAGSQAAFTALVRRHQRRAYAICRAILASHEDAEDALQEGFLNAFRAIDRFRADQPFGPWLHRIMANASRDLRRRREVRAAESLPENMAAQSRELTDEISNADLLKAGLEVLTDRQRAVIVLYDVEGFAHSEIAALLGIPEGTAKSDLHIARRKLRARLAPFRAEMF